MDIITRALAMRRQALLRERNSVLASPSRVRMAILGACRNAAARDYRSISEELGIEIIWGEGGAQTAKKRELDAEGTNYVVIPSRLYSKAVDIKNGFNE